MITSQFKGNLFDLNNSNQDDFDTNQLAGLLIQINNKLEKPIRVVSTDKDFTLILGDGTTIENISSKEIINELLKIKESL